MMAVGIIAVVLVLVVGFLWMRGRQSASEVKQDSQRGESQGKDMMRAMQEKQNRGMMGGGGVSERPPSTGQ